MLSISAISDKSLLKTSKAAGSKFVTKLEDETVIYAHDKNTNNVFKISIIRDKRSETKYFVKSDEFDKKRFVADGESYMIYFRPIIIARIGATVKSKENIYFSVDSNIDLYE